MSVFGLKLEPGTFWATLLCQDIQVPLYINPACTLNSTPWEWFSMLLLGVLSPTETHSSFRFLGYLSLNTPPVRAAVEMWGPSSGKSSSRHQQTTAHYSWLPRTFHFYTTPSGAPRTPLIFGEATCLCPCRGGKHSSEFWLVENLQDFLFLSSGGWFHFSGKSSKKQKPRIKPDFMVIFLNLEVYWQKRQRREKSVSITEHIQTAKPRAFGDKNNKLFLMRIIKEILSFYSFNSSCLNLLSPVRN